MQERRRNRRMDLTSRLILDRLDGNSEQEVQIEIINVSKTGVGFTSQTPLEISSVYEGYLTIWTKEVIHAFIEIVRIEKKENGYEYGGMFVGMPDLDAKRIEIYEAFEDKDDDIIIDDDLPEN